MTLKPMADNVLLKAQEAPETTASGIILATTSKEAPAVYEVVAVGPGTKDVTCLLYTSPSPRDSEASRMPSSA